MFMNSELFSSFSLLLSSFSFVFSKIIFTIVFDIEKCEEMFSKQKLDALRIFASHIEKVEVEFHQSPCHETFARAHRTHRLN